MDFNKRSILNFSMDFKIRNFTYFNKSIKKKLKSIKKKKYITISKRYEGVKVNYFKTTPIFSITLDLNSVNIEKIRKKFNKLVKKGKSLEEKYEKKKLVRGEKSEISKKFKRFKDLVKRIKEQEEWFKYPKCMINLNYSAMEDFNEDQMNNMLQIKDISDIMYIIDEIVTNDIKFNVRTNFFFNKSKYSLIQGFELRKKLEFPKKVKERLGDSFLEKLTLNIENSPIGIKNLAFGEDNECYNIDIVMNYEASKISDLTEKFKLLIEIMKKFIQEIKID